MQGNVLWPGDFYECRTVVAQQTPKEIGFAGQYCTFAWNLTIMNGFMSFPVSMGMCVPDTCSEKMLLDLTNVKNLLKRLPKKLVRGWTFEVTGVTCKPASLELDAPAIGMLCLLSLFIVLVVSGTSVTVAETYLTVPFFKNYALAGNTGLDDNADSVMKQDSVNDENYLIRSPPKNAVLMKLKQFVKCFCILTNGAKLLSTAGGSGELRSIHGIRFLSMTWVILGHTYAFAVTVGLSGNLRQLSKAIDNLPFQVISEGTFSVDSFFVLSGFLLSYLFLQEMNRNDGKISWPFFYFHRYWRLTPAYAVVLGFDIALTRYLSEGPFWPPAGNEGNCAKNYWWWNLLYVNNFVDTTHSCMGWSWYLANDMQFYVISPIFLYLLWRRPKIGLTVIAVVIASSWICAGVITYHYDLLAGYITLTQVKDPLEYTKRMADYFEKMYIKPYTRIAPYLIGVALGYVIHIEKNRKTFIPWFIQVIGWLIASFLSLGMIYGFYHVDPGLIGACFINSLSRSCFAAALAWLIFVCLTGRGGFVNQLLSWKLFMPLSRLTYCAYLVHPIIIMGYYQSLPKTMQITHTTMVTLFLGFLVMTYCTAFGTSLAFESPLMAVEKVALGKTTKNVKNKESAEPQ